MWSESDMHICMLPSTRNVSAGTDVHCVMHLELVDNFDEPSKMEVA